jgi:hypothetical protein
MAQRRFGGSAPAPPRLRILSPHPGARTGQTLTVHVAVSGAARAGGHKFWGRYAEQAG